MAQPRRPRPLARALRSAALAAAFGSVSSLASLCAAAPLPEIKPPFGLYWDQPADQIERLLSGAKARVVNRGEVDGRDAWTVEGLAQANLRRSVFYFRSGGLVEVELQYQNDEWTSMKYSDFMSAVRRKIEERYGAGKLIARQRSQDGGLAQTVVGYKWNQNNTSIQLIYFSAEDSANTFRAVSVHYRAF